MFSIRYGWLIKCLKADIQTSIFGDKKNTHLSDCDNFGKPRKKCLSSGLKLLVLRS